MVRLVRRAIDQYNCVEQQQRSEQKNINLFILSKPPKWSTETRGYEKNKRKRRLTAAQAARGRLKDGGNLSFLEFSANRVPDWPGVELVACETSSRPLALSSHPLTLPHDLPRSVHSILRLFNLHPPSLPLFISHLSLPRSHHITKQTTQFVKFGPSHSSASIMSTSGDGVSTPKASIDRPTTITSMHTLTPSESIKRSLPPVLIDKADVDPPYLDVRRFNPLRHDLHWIQEVFVTHSMFSFTSI